MSVWSAAAAAALLVRKGDLCLSYGHAEYVMHRWLSSDWLSFAAGEQQRLGMARLFFHKPRFGVLDECTNATSVDVEEHLYQYAAQLGITLVTITQRLALVKYHDAELRLLDGEGDWELRQIIK